MFRKLLRSLGITLRDRRTLKRAAKLRRMSPAQLRASTRRRSKRYDKYR